MPDHSSINVAYYFAGLLGAIFGAGAIWGTVREKIRFLEFRLDAVERRTEGLAGNTGKHPLLPRHEGEGH